MNGDNVYGKVARDAYEARRQVSGLNMFPSGVATRYSQCAWKLSIEPRAYSGGTDLSDLGTWSASQSLSSRAV